MSKRAKFDQSKVTVESEQMTTPIPSTNPMAGPGAAISPPIVERDGYIVPEANRGVTPADVQRGMQSRVAAAIPPEQFGPPSPRVPRGMDAAGQAMIGALTGNQAQMRAGMAGIPAAEPNMPVPTFGFTRPDRPAPPNVSTGRSKAAPTQNQFAQSDWRRMSTSLEAQGLGGQTPVTFGSDPYAQMRQRSVPAEQQQTYGGQTVQPRNAWDVDRMDPRTSDSYRDSMQRAGLQMQGGQASAMSAPAPTMAPGAPSGFAQRRGLEGAAAAMQAPRTAAERIENQPNLFDRMMAAKEGSPERQRLERQFNALPADAQAAQRERSNPFGDTDPNTFRQRRENAQWAFARARGEMGGGPQAQPQYQPGQIVGSGQYGSAIVGAAGAQMPYVQDPMNPDVGALPVSAGMTRDQYMSNITPGQRQGIRSMLVEQGGPIADQLQQIEKQRQSLATSPAMRGRDGAPRPYVGPQEQLLQQQEDDLIYGAMRDPGAMIAGRQRMATEQQRQTEQQQRASQVEMERQQKMQQQRNAKMFEQAYKEAESELADPFQPRNERQIQARAMQKYMQAGGGIAGMENGIGPGAGMLPPGQAAVESGAPDFSQEQMVYVDPSSPVDFEMTGSGNIVTVLPDGEVMAGMNFQGQAVAMPRNAVEVGMLPPGTKYVLPGEVSRGQGKILTKEGTAGGLSEAARVPMAQEQEKIRASAERVAGERAKTVQSYQKDLDEYNRLEIDARRQAVEMFNKRYGLTLQVDASGNPNFEDPDVVKRFAPRNIVSETLRQATGYSRDAQPPRAADARGAFENEVQIAMLGLAQERYQDEKQPPSWVSRVGTEITGVEKPRPPAGFREGMEPGAVAPEDIEMARQEYFRAQGARPENVMAERLVDEASRAWRSAGMKRGKMVVTFRGQEMPATKVTIGGVTATMPRPETAEQVMALLRSQRPFAVEQAGRAMPYKFDPGDPMVQAVFGERNKVIPANLGAGQANAGANAAIRWANETFGYLPLQVRKSIASALLAEAGYKLTG